MWHQRSRVLWLREGDNNTSYFHRKANARRKSLISSSVICRSIPWSMVAFLQDLVFCSRVWAPTVIGYSAQGAAN
ncbi:unnamed protein product [Rhodiola kirilowii]